MCVMGIMVVDFVSVYRFVFEVAFGDRVVEIIECVVCSCVGVVFMCLECDLVCEFDVMYVVVKVVLVVVVNCVLGVDVVTSKSLLYRFIAFLDILFMSV